MNKRAEVFFLVMLFSLFILGVVFALTLSDTITGMAAAEDEESDMGYPEQNTLTTVDSSTLDEPRSVG